MHLVRNAIAASPHLEKKNSNDGRMHQIPHQTPKCLSTPKDTVNKCKVQPVLEAADLNMFLNKNILESSKTDGK